MNLVHAVATIQKMKTAKHHKHRPNEPITQNTSLKENTVTSMTALDYD